MFDLDRMPDWMRWLFGVTLCTSLLLGFIVTIMLVSYWTRGPYHPVPPESCGSYGVKSIDQNQADQNTVVVCNNGRVIVRAW